MSAYFIAVDLEGVALAVGSGPEAMGRGENYRTACRQAVREVNAAARALFDGGAGRVVVWDNHGPSCNLDYEAVDPRCELLVGAGPAHRFCLLEEGFDGVLLIGYHAMDGAPDAVLAHSFSSRSYQGMWIGDRRVGEMAIDGALAGEHGVPVILVVSDQAGCAEAEAFFGPIPTVATKRALGWNMALCRHPDWVDQQVYQAARQAMAAPRPAPLAFPAPMIFTRRYKRINELEADLQDGWERVDAYTLRRTVASLTELY